MKTIEQQCKEAFDHRHICQNLSSEDKVRCLNAVASAIEQEQDAIVNANNKDVSNGKTNGLSTALIDRLQLNTERIAGICASIREISALENPIGEALDTWTRPNGLTIQKVRVPLGCIGMIYEARPNVTADAIAIALKTGNAIVLRGSASAYESNLAIVTIVKNTLKNEGVSANFIQLLEDTNRESVKHFVQLNDYLALVIPRGGASLIQNVVKSATVPTIETGVGNCHIYVDEFANIDNAIDIVDNAKTQRPSVCNACETVLVHEKVASGFLATLQQRFESKDVEIMGCDKTLRYISSATPATEADWDTEYNDLKISIRVVNTIQDAITHIQQHGTLHTEAIISDNKDHTDLFISQVDASSIIVNASTRFTDGGEFGFGAEIGISTQKLHARGPMGIKELTSYKYIVEGSGQIRH